MEEKIQSNPTQIAAYKDFLFAMVTDLHTLGEQVLIERRQ